MPANSAPSIETAYELHKHAAYGRHLRLCKLLERAAAGEGIHALASELIPLELEAELGALSLAERVNALSEPEQVGLVRCTADEYMGWHAVDPDLSDLVQLKHEIYRYILAPSAAVAAAHAYHVAQTSAVGA
jgi:hypothetical protein